MNSVIWTEFRFRGISWERNSAVRNSVPHIPLDTLFSIQFFLQTIPASHIERTCLVGRFHPREGDCETVYTTGTQLTCFLFAKDTRGLDWTATGDRWRQVQEDADGPEISTILRIRFFDCSLEFGPQRHICLSSGRGLTPCNAMFWSRHCLGFPLGFVGNDVKFEDIRIPVTVPCNPQSTSSTFSTSTSLGLQISLVSLFF